MRGDADAPIRVDSLMRGEAVVEEVILGDEDDETEEEMRRRVEAEERQRLLPFLD